MNPSPFPSFSGTVIEWKRLGRSIGFPTANIRINESDVAPATYGIQISLEEKVYFWVGVHIVESYTFEAHIFDFSEEIYGKTLTITPLIKIRDNQKFTSLDALKEQIQKDKENMERWMQTTMQK